MRLPLLIKSDFVGWGQTVLELSRICAEWVRQTAWPWRL